MESVRFCEHTNDKLYGLEGLKVHEIKKIDKMKKEITVLTGLIDPDTWYTLLTSTLSSTPMSITDMSDRKFVKCLNGTLNSLSLSKNTDNSILTCSVNVEIENNNLKPGQQIHVFLTKVTDAKSSRK